MIKRLLIVIPVVVAPRSGTGKSKNRKREEWFMSEVNRLYVYKQNGRS